MKYYHTAERDLKNKNIKGKPKFIHVADRLLLGFNSLYLEMRGSEMVFCDFFLHSCVEKLSGNPNLKYVSNALYLCIALGASGNCK